jgi:hypothetical protein
MTDLSTRPKGVAMNGPSPIVNRVTQVALGIIVLFSVVSFTFELDKPAVATNVHRTGALMAIRR